METEMREISRICLERRATNYLGLVSATGVIGAEDSVLMDLFNWYIKSFRDDSEENLEEIEFE
jgi:hypothetical protein